MNLKNLSDNITAHAYIDTFHYLTNPTNYQSIQKAVKQLKATLAGHSYPVEFDVDVITPIEGLIIVKAKHDLTPEELATLHGYVAHIMSKIHSDDYFDVLAGHFDWRAFDEQQFAPIETGGD